MNIFRDYIKNDRQLKKARLGRRVVALRNQGHTWRDAARLSNTNVSRARDAAFKYVFGADRLNGRRILKGDTWAAQFNWHGI